MTEPLFAAEPSRLLIGLGSLFGGILEISGGAQCVAQTISLERIRQALPWE